MRAPYSTCSLTETESSHYIIKFIIAIWIFLLIYIFVVIRCWLVHITIDTYMVYTLHIYVLECETKGIHQSKWMCLHLRINEFNYKLTHELHCHLSIAHCCHDLWQVQVDWLWYVTMSFLRHLHQLTWCRWWYFRP